DNVDFSDFFANLFGQTGGGAGGYQQRGEDRHAKIMIDLMDAYKGATQTITLQSRQYDDQRRVVLKDRNLKVQIPKGVKEGQHIRLSGEGSAGIGGGTAGDLYLEIHFKPHSHYRVESKNVYETLPITPWEAALGAVIEAPTPAGVVKLTIPPNSQT